MSLPLLALRRQLATSTARGAAIRHVTVVGAGLMGSGIAQVAAQTGHDVTLVDVSDAALQRARDAMHKSLQRLAKKMFKGAPAADGERFLSESMGRISTTTDVETAVRDTCLVVEAVVEDMSTKHSLFARIDPLAHPRAVFVSNTSSFSIAEIASVTTRKDRFGGLHFFNPVPMMKLLEVIRIDETSDDTYARMMAWGEAMGKTCVTCKDTPGFVVNRLLVPMFAEAVRLLERGDATARDIDTAMKLGAGFPMGPFELADYTGNDTNKSVLDGWHKKFPDNPLFTPVGLLNTLVDEGKLGLKTGEGFYKYDKKSKM